MQVMHALVGCQKRWINNLARRFHSVDMLNALVNADTRHEFRLRGAQAFQRAIAPVMDRCVELCAIAVGQKPEAKEILPGDQTVVAPCLCIPKGDAHRSLTTAHDPPNQL
jgi:hypothetical protein